MDRSWRNQLVFPMLIASSLLYSFLLKKMILLLIAMYLILHICYKKQVTLLLLSLFVAFLFFLRVGIKPATLPPTEQELTIIVRIYPDTIQVKESFVTMEGKAAQGEVFLQYPLKNAQESNHWQSRKDQNVTIRATGVFKQADPARNLHGFDRQWYEWTENKVGTFRITTILQTKPNSRWHFGRAMRARAIDWVETEYSPKIATYIKALLLGYRDNQFREIREVYNSSGILHLFSISGMHMSLFLGWCLTLFRYSRLTFEEFSIPFLVVTLLLVFLFGQGISILRATLMYLVNILCKERQWHFSALDRFSFVICLLLLIEPKSFVQTSGVLSILLSFIILMSSDNRKNPFISSMEISLLASPILMFYFYEIPLLAGILTALITPLFSFMLLPGLLFSSLWHVLGLPSSLIDSWMTSFLKLLETIIQFSHSFLVTTGKPALWFGIVIFLVGLACATATLKHRILFFVSMMIFILLPSFPLKTAVSFVDVGQGDSIVFQSFGNQKVYVVDTGGKVNFYANDSDKVTKNAEYTLIPFLKGEGIRQIDGLFLTHGDFDHMGDIEEILREFSVETLYVAEGMLHHQNMVNLDSELFKRTAVVELRQGDRVGVHPTFEVLSPFERGTGENKDSLVLASVIKEVRFLLMGDLEEEGERRLINEYPNLHTDILKLGHHGSRTSSSEGFLQHVQPKHGIISCGVNNQFKHPHAEVLDHLETQKIKVLRTDEQGMIRYEWSMFSSHPQITTAIQSTE